MSKKRNKTQIITHKEITKKDARVIMARPIPGGVTRDDPRYDGWMNALTSLGVVGRDKRMAAYVDLNILSRGQIDALYQQDDIGARIINRPAEEMFREGYEVKVAGKTEVDLKQFGMQLEALDVNKKFEWAKKMGDAYGGAAIVMGIVDGRLPEEPVDINNISSIDYLTVLDRFELVSSGMIDTDLKSKNFGKPELYRVALNGSVNANSSPLIHNTRILRFEGVEMPRRLSGYFDYWGDSKFSRIYNALRNYQTANDSAATIMQDFTQVVLKMKELGSILASGDDEQLIKRLHLATQTSSILNALVIRDDEEIEKKTTNVAGLPELLKSVANRLAAATDIPHTILFGESASGLGATGESEKRDFYDHIKSRQESEITPLLQKLIEYMMRAKKGPFGGKLYDFEIEYRPLWQLSETEQIKNKLALAQADEIYMVNQVLSPDEVRESRFGSGQYSYEIEISEGESYDFGKNPEGDDGLGDPQLTSRKRKAISASTSA